MRGALAPRGVTMNRIEAMKAEKDGLDVQEDLARFAREGWKTLGDDDKERLKWVGVFHRRPTPGHFMMRVRMPNGIVSAAQARLLGEITREAGRASGRPIADVTTRQQIQLRWVTLENVPEVIARLEAAGLSSLQTGMDNIRGIIGCPATGLTPGELLDTAPIATAFQKIFLGNKEFTNLPRKFNVTITGCLEHCTGGETQDISLTPAVTGHEPGFNLAVGGKQGSGGPVFATPLDAFVRPDEAADVCAAIALVFRDHGPRESRSKARLAFLLEVWGAARMRAELEKRLGRSLPPAGADARLATHTDHVGVFRQKQAGLNYVGLKTPVGRLTGEQLLELARLAEQYGRGELRFTPLQNVLLPHVPDARLGDLTQEPLLRALPYNPSEVARGLVACTGTDFCNLALIDTKTRALALAKEFEARFGSTRPIAVRWSGCPAGCGNHHTADIGLQGCKVKVNGKIVDGVHVFVGGRGGADARAGLRILEDLPCDQLPEVLERLVRFFPRAERKPEAEP
ncbi:MAG: ferredoxin--nitrite reductase [Candidatus Rokuibacteriota bacterium]|nr:MAG: ferredoxin--nitrite reductase [Candidatus Rokubacteria bacterium]PYN21060.1 MAG: ferredoxin--nitrite reductase [Candidatus Rokubacteria bacterium]